MKVIFKEHPKPDGSFLAEIKLNRPETLNALDLEIILTLKKQLNKWKNNSCLSAVFLHGEGNKAFCAGGDIKSLYSSILSAYEKKEDPGQAVQPFFENEYRLDYLIHTYPYPVIAWGHSFIMGGGMGLFLASSHKVMTENSALSMPEINIGLFPDVGVSYTLSRLPFETGWYLALTGCRLNYREAQFLGLADFYFNNKDKKEVLQTLISSSFTDKQELSAVLKNIQKNTSFQENWIEKNKDQIASLFKSKTIKDIYKKFYNSAIEADKRWQKNRQVFLQSSPTSAGIICEQLKRAKTCNLKEIFQMDLILALNCARGLDFPEGVKTLLIKKNDIPKWKPDSIEKVQDCQIQNYFKPLPDWTNPLQNI